MDISQRFAELDKAHKIGRLHINISGCINACGHHHVGHIGILGVEKNGEEFYQITLGGKADENAALGQLLGPSVPYAHVGETVERIVQRYVELRQSDDELFVDTVKRVGLMPFKDALHAVH
jgi:sulfite reductase (NADPH) hemoprotein beta-component